MSEAAYKALDAALNEMNQALLIAIKEGSPKAMEHIAEYLNWHDALDEDVANEVDVLLAGRTFPPDLVQP